MVDVALLAAIIAPYLAKGADSFAASIGQKAANKMVNLYKDMKGNYGDRFLNKSQQDIENILVHEMEKDEALVENLKTHLDNIERKIIIDDFDTGIWGYNKIGGSTLVYQENGDPISLRHDFVSRDSGGRALNLRFDFNNRPGYIKPRFVGYATRLQFFNWTNFTKLGGTLSFDLWGVGVKDIYIEIKRLPIPEDEHVREEIAMCLIDIDKNWKTIRLKFSEIAKANKEWDNLWELCFVIKQENLLAPTGNIIIDNIFVERPV